MTEGEVRKKKEIAVVFVTLLIVCVAVAVMILVINKNGLGENVDKNIAESISVSELSENIEDKFNNELDYSLGDAINEYESAMETGTSAYRVYVAIYYATFIYEVNNDIDEATDVLERVESLVDNDTAIDYYVTMRQLYEAAGMSDEADFYNQKVLELTPQDTRPVEELMKGAEVQE